MPDPDGGGFCAPGCLGRFGSCIAGRLVAMSRRCVPGCSGRCGFCAPGRLIGRSCRCRVPGRLGLFARGVAPYEPAVESCQYVVDLHRTVGVQPRLVVERAVDQRHDESHDPQPDIGAVFEPEIEQPQHHAGNLQDKFPIHRFICVASLRIGFRGDGICPLELYRDVG